MIRAPRLRGGKWNCRGQRRLRHENPLPLRRWSRVASSARPIHLVLLNSRQASSNAVTTSGVRATAPR